MIIREKYEKEYDKYVSSKIQTLSCSWQFISGEKL